jgi:WD40 repeat protein
LWLPYEPDIGKARVLSFGYNANFRGGSSKGISNIADFAKELLYEMAFGKDENGEDLGIGKVPIIFVVHSMGGLVVKKAYILGQNDEEYQSIVRSISAIMFLATPHRGTNLAEILNRVLTVSFQSTKNFITDLNKSSPALEEINEQFRHIAPKLSIVSFYETLATTVGPKKIMVLEKDSSILGYPKEVSRALNADHHDVCKYASPEDSNYISVRNALKTLVGRFRSKGMDFRSNKILDDAKDIKRILGISAGPDEDFKSFRRWWMPGTCEWLLHEPTIQAWLEEMGESRVVWFSAPPATGKSILSTHIISHLLNSNLGCQYFFFKFGDQTKRSLSTLLRSIAWQLARDVPAFRRILVELSAEGINLEKPDSVLIWQKLFESGLFELELDRPLYWVIDALDESESPKALLDLFKTLSNSITPIRIFIVSRKTEPLFLAFDRLSGSVDVELIEKDEPSHNSVDIQMLVEKEMKHMRGSQELKQQVTQSILSRAGGNFLWVRLVLEEILSCHTEEAIQETLEEIPSDMTKLYQRMEVAILNNPRKSNRQLAIALFQWTICAHHSLTLKELSQALRPEFPEFIDLRRTIQDVCGQFVLVNQNGEVGMVHQTARDYLIQSSNKEIAINVRQAHGQLFAKAISVLLDPKIRLKLTQSQRTLQGTEPFIFYAATSWTYHLRHSGASSDAYLDLLVKLFKSTSVLTWIHSLALIGRLEILITAAKVLTTFVSSHRKQNAAKNPLLHRLSDLELLDLWIIDLVKVVGKFSTNLVSDPLAIYKLVPPFCPEKSIIYRQFHHPESAEISISGILNPSWNDNLARMTLPNNDQAWKIGCAGSHIAVLGSAGTIIIYSSSNFAELCTLRHHEPITSMCLNSKGNTLVTYGLRSTKLWHIPSGQLSSLSTNPADCKSMSITFCENDSKILTGGDDKVIRYIYTDDFEAGWRVLDPSLLQETTEIEGTFVNSPMWMAFNADATQVGVCYRGFPLSVWSLEEMHCIGRCTRVRDQEHGRPSTSWFAVDRFTWNPVTGHIIGIYRDGCIFKWHPVTDENQEVQSQADEVAASSDGKLFVTSNSNGTVKVWNFQYFSVIYQLSSSDLVTGLSFSPDCRRFYDLRGCSINAWESNSLIRFSESEDSFSDAASEDQSITPTSISHVSEAYVAEFEPVSAVAGSPFSPLYCVGNEEGAVDLFDAQTGKEYEIARFLNFLGICHLLWSADGTHIAAADLGGDIVLKRLITGDLKSGAQVKPLVAPKLDLEGRGIHQMLFNHDSMYLLVICDDLAQIWSVYDNKLHISVEILAGASRKWVGHPTKPSLILGFGANDLKFFQWHDFQEISSHSYKSDLPRLNSQASFEFKDNETLNFKRLSLSSDSDSEVTTSVIKAISTQDEKHVLLHLKDTSTQGRSTKRLLLFENTALDAAGEQIPYVYIPPSITTKVNIALGVLAGARLAFLDQDNWVCTYKLGSSHDDKAMKRHYFIPRDWANTDSLEYCCMMRDGTFLCPKDDKVAVIRGNLEVLQALR